MADDIQARLRAMEEEERELEQTRLRFKEEQEKKTKKLQAARKRLARQAEEEQRKEKIKEELRRQYNENRVDAEHWHGCSFTFPYDFGYGEGNEIITFLVSDKDSNPKWRPYGGHGGRKPRWYTEKLDKEKFHRKEAYALGQGVHGSSAVPVEVIRTSKRRKVKDEEEADERDDGIASIADMLRLNTAALSTMSTSLNNFIDHQQRQDKRMDLQSKEIHALYRKVAESNQAVVGDVKLLCKQGQLFYEALKDVRMKHDEEQQTKDLKAAQEKIKKLNQQLSNMLKFQQEPATALTRSVSEVIALNASQTTLTETGAVPAVEQGAVPVVEQGEDTREDVSKCDDIPTSR
jgi:hypothetical protein